MSILESENSKKRKELDKIKESLKGILKNESIACCLEFKEHIKQACLELENFSHEEKKLLELKGKVYSIHETAEIIKKVSGYKNWKFYEDKKISSDEIQDIKNTFEVDFKKDIIKKFEITRDVRTRNEISLIEIISLPGVFRVRYETGRAGCSIKGLVDEQEMIKELQKEFCY